MVTPSEESFSFSKPANKINTNFIIKVAIIAIIGTGIYFGAQKYRGLVLAGMVNSSPITRWELNSAMSDKYGKQTFEEIVSERLLAEEMTKNKISVTDQEVDTEMANIKKQYGGDEAFNQAIAQFGLTEAKAKKSIKQSLGLKKIIEKDNQIVIADADAKKYFDDNKQAYEGKKFEDVTVEIKDLLTQQEIYTKSQEWFAQVRKEAKVSSFL